MKTIIQSEAAECGLASLAMVADANGMKLGLAEMRRRFPLSLKGASLSRLMVVAGQLSFQCRPLRLDMEHLGELKLPCILHRDLNHFVVLAKGPGIPQHHHACHWRGTKRRALLPGVGRVGPAIHHRLRQAGTVASRHAPGCGHSGRAPQVIRVGAGALYSLRGKLGQ